MARDRTEIVESVEHEYREINLDKVSKVLAEYGVETHQGRMMAPLIALLIEKQVEVMTLLLRQRHKYDKLLLTQYEKSKRRHYAARSADGGCCFNAADALRESEDDALHELECLTRQYRQASRQEQQQMATMSMMLLKLLGTVHGSPELPAGDVLKQLLPKKSRRRQVIDAEEDL